MGMDYRYGWGKMEMEMVQHTVTAHHTCNPCLDAPQEWVRIYLVLSPVINIRGALSAFVFLFAAS